MFLPLLILADISWGTAITDIFKNIHLPASSSRPQQMATHSHLFHTHLLWNVLVCLHSSWFSQHCIPSISFSLCTFPIRGENNKKTTLFHSWWWRRFHLFTCHSCISVCPALTLNVNFYDGMSFPIPALSTRANSEKYLLQKKSVPWISSLLIMQTCLIGISVQYFRISDHIGWFHTLWFWSKE